MWLVNDTLTVRLIADQECECCSEVFESDEDDVELSLEDINQINDDGWSDSISSYDFYYESIESLVAESGDNYWICNDCRGTDEANEILGIDVALSQPSKKGIFKL